MLLAALSLRVHLSGFADAPGRIKVASQDGSGATS
jgi:hypothetical protein